MKSAQLAFAVFVAALILAPYLPAWVPYTLLFVGSLYVAVVGPGYRRSW